jgi:O-antigen ligase
MRAEPAIAEARKRAGPRFGGDDGSYAFRARLEESAAFLAPLALLVGLALGGGGFSVTSRHIAGLAIWILVAALLALGAASRATVRRPFYWASGLILGLALFSAISSLWSGSVELSVTEADRVLVYLGVFVAAFLVAQTNKRAQRCAEGLAIGLAIVALLGLASRLLPHVLSVGEGLDTGARLRYPLGYWNANAMACGLGAALLLWTNRSSPTAALRWIAVGALPLVMLTLYFTYSRGGVLALAIACGGLIVLSRDRLWLTAVLAAAGLGALPAILAAQARRALADNVSGPEVVGQGVTVTLILVAGTALTLLLYAGLRRLERGGSRPVRRAEEVTRDRRVLRWSAAVAILVVLVAGVAFGGRAWHSFSKAEVSAASPQERFSGLSGSGRQDYWRVALDAFKEDPVGGKGAGTYQFAWNRLRAIPTSNQVAHSLFLEELADLGVVGAALTVALVLFLLWVGFEAWRRARGPTRELYAVLLAVSLAFVVGAAIDWFWQIAAVGAVFFIATGILVAGRCAQIAAERRERDGADAGEGRRFGLAVTGLVIAWLTAIALTGPLLVEREIKSSQSAAANGDLADARSHAETAHSIEPWAASPYLQLGLLDEAAAEYPAGAGRLGQAIDHEEENWVLYYLRARIEHEGGESAAAAADLAEAQRLNPLEACLGEGFQGCG